jgi:hypothetical protein
MVLIEECKPEEILDWDLSERETYTHINEEFKVGKIWGKSRKHCERISYIF